MDSMFTQSGSTLRAIPENPWSKSGGEKAIENLLADNPHILATVQLDIEKDLTFVTVCTQPQKRRNIADLLLLDQNAVPTIVEVKLGSNHEIRRKVLAQGIDYLANILGVSSAADLIKFGNDYWRAKGKDFEDVCKDGFSSFDREGYMEMLSANLEGHVFRLLLVSDSFPEELTNMMNFMNETSSPWEVHGVEIKRFASQEDSSAIITLDCIRPPQKLLENKVPSSESKARTILQIVRDGIQDIFLFRAKGFRGPNTQRTHLGAVTTYSDESIEAIWIGYFFAHGTTDGLPVAPGNLCIKVVIPLKYAKMEQAKSELMKIGFDNPQGNHVLGKTIPIEFDSERMEVSNIDEVRRALASLRGILVPS